MKKQNRLLVIMIIAILMVCLFVGCDKSNNKTYIISFDTMGGSRIDPITIEEGKAITLPKEPTKEGYSFYGWYLDEEFVEEFNTKGKISSDITLYAKWGPFKGEQADDGQSILYSDKFIVNGYVLTLNQNEFISAEKNFFSLQDTFVISDRAEWKAFTSENCSKDSEVNASNLKLSAGWNYIYINVQNKETGSGNIYKLELYKYPTISYNTLADGTLEVSYVEDCQEVRFPINLPDKITRIGSCAFIHCTTLTNVIFPNTITEIADYAFSAYYGPSCTALISITIPDSVKTIGAAAFSGCTALTTVNIGNGVNTIGDSAFSGCTALTTVNIGNGVNTIDDSAFEGCVNLAEISISDSVTSIGTDAFKETAWYEKQPDGVVYFGKIAYSYKGNMSEKTSVSLLDGTIAIANQAFYHYRNLIEIVLPNSIRNIGDFAFYGCSSLVSITIPKSVTSIGDSAFRGCSSLTSITVPDSVTSIGENCFKDTAWYYDLPDGVIYINKIACQYKGTIPEDGIIVIEDGTTAISDCFFSDWDSNRLIEISLPDSITKIGYDAFMGCNNISRVNISSLSQWLDIEFESANSNPLYYGGKLYVNGEPLGGDITIPEGVTEIGSYAFYGYKELTAITIPDSVTNIRESAFMGCENINKVNISSLEKWLDVEFESYSSTPLSYGGKLYVNDDLIEGDITIPESVTKIGPYAFYNYTMITRVTIPNSVISISSAAFAGCSGLTSITIPTSVTSIGTGAFSDCSGLTSITIPDSVTTIRDYAFDGCSSLTEIAIPDSITSIGVYAFSNCSSLTEITIPDSVTSIGSCAFMGCGKLGIITLGKGVNKVGFSAFFQWPESSITEIRISSLSQWLDIEFGGDTSNPLNYGGKLYVNGEPLEGDITIPDGVTEIGAYAFSGYKALTGITIPESVASIGFFAFSNCSNIAKTSLPNSIITIGGGAFYNCSSLTSITIPDGVTSIGGGAFYGCSSLAEITIPSSVTIIRDYAFSGCSSLTDVTMGNSVTDINCGAFENCSNLTQITIPDTVTNIEDSAFAGCDKLIDITISKNLTSIGSNVFNDTTWYANLPNGLLYLGKIAYKYVGEMPENTDINIKDGTISIGDSAFSGYSNLSTITIPDSVTSIGKNAFKDCTGIKELEIPINVTSFKLSVLEGCVGIEKLTILSGLTDLSYRAFSKLTNLTDLKICGLTNIDRFAFNDCNKLKKIFIDGDISIESNSFYGCSNLTNITIGDGVTSIEDMAFYGCSNLTEVIIGNNVSSIKRNAFYGCSNLTNITIGDSVTSIEGGAFYGCYNLVEVYNKSSLEISVGSSDNGCVAYYAKAVYTEPYTSKISMDDNGYKTYEDGDDIILIGYNGNETALSLPNGITQISPYVFNGNNSLISVVIPDSVTIIGEYAFKNCVNLITVTIGCGVTSIEDMAFDGCYRLFEVCNKSLLDISVGSTENGLIACFAKVVYTDTEGERKFLIDENGYVIYTYENEKILVAYTGTETALTLPSYITQINQFAFYDCSNLVSITIPDSVTSIGDCAFAGCCNLISITIPDSVTSIGCRAFHGCWGLTSITFEDATTWYCTQSRTDWSNKTGGTVTNVTDASTNATYFTSSYSLYYWYKE